MGRRPAGLAFALALVGGASLEAAAVPVVPTVTVTATPDQVRTAEFVKVKVTFTNVTGQGIGSVDYGDGTAYWWGDFSFTSCLEPPPTTESSYTVELRHAYRYPGRYVVRASFSRDCGFGEPQGPVYAGMTTLQVTSGPNLSNGPEPPMLPDIPWYQPDRPKRHTVYGDFFSGDEDGYLTRIAWSWGDGSRPTGTITRSLADCEDPETHWPQSYTYDPILRSHTYAKAGRYKVTMTVTSSGCDGKDVQTRRVVYPITVR